MVVVEVRLERITKLYLGVNSFHGKEGLDILAVFVLTPSSVVWSAIDYFKFRFHLLPESSEDLSDVQGNGRSISFWLRWKLAERPKTKGTILLLRLSLACG